MTKKQTENVENDITVFEVTTGYGARTEKGYVQVLIHRADFMTQMSPENARELAFNLLGAAEAADGDAFLMDFLKNRVGVESVEERAAVLVDLRTYRDQQRIAEEKEKDRLNALHPSQIPAYIFP